MRVWSDEGRSLAESRDPLLQQHLCSPPGFVEFSQTEIEQSIPARFAAQVTAHGACLALRDRGSSFSYRDLDAWANGIAVAVLNRLGAGPEPVALVLSQGAACAAAILGVLKTGKAYVPLDPSDPRRGDMAADVGSRLTLTDAESADQAASLAGGKGAVLVVDEIGPAEDPGLRVAPDAVAYVFYTSGSTGRPKGVYDSHRNVLHNILRYTNSLRIEPHDRLTLLQAPSFSGSVSSLFCALLNGAAVLPFRLAEAGVGSFARWLSAERITIYHSVPSIFRSFLKGDMSFPDVRVVRLEGDRASGLDVELHRRYFTPDSVLVNGLGATETGIARQLFVDAAALDDGGILPVGYPVRDMDIVILADDGSEVPEGTVGEIAVRSRYLALGYWNRPELTEQAFLRDPSGGDARTYRTGDMGRLQPDGCLEYLGRRDLELKVLGSRVEPGEVETELLRLPGVRDALVTTREGRSGEGRLVAYVVPEAGRDPTVDEMRRQLGRRLPRYLIPSALVVLDELPLGQNGKVDRRALPVVPVQAVHRPPADETERLVCGIWEDVLEVRPLGVDDDFFALGGDSLAAAQIIAQIEADLGVLLPLGSLLSAPTIARLAAALLSPPDASLVILEPEGKRAPLVFCHGQTGNTLLYAEVVRRLESDRPVWGLDAPVLDDFRIEAIAERHLDALRSAQPNGPYVLAGFCAGAVIAFELAHRLYDANERIALLAMLGISPIDFPSLVDPQALNRWRGSRRHRTPLRRLRRHLIRARALPGRQRPVYLVHRGRAAASLLMHRVTGRPVRDPDLAMSLALAAYRPRPYPGRATLVLARNTTAHYSDDPARDWGRLALEGVDVFVLPGGDHDMLEEPLVEQLAAHLQTALAPLP